MLPSRGVPELSQQLRIRVHLTRIRSSCLKTAGAEDSNLLTVVGNVSNLLNTLSAGSHASDYLWNIADNEVFLDRSNEVQSSELYGHYRSWCGRHRERPLADKQLKAPFEALDLVYERQVAA